MKIWVTSDTHFGDVRLINTGWTRDQFKTVEEMDQYIIKQWNSVVKKDDIVIHLGDVIGNKNGDNDNDLKNRWMQVKKLNGKKVLLEGNYDRGVDKNLFYEAGFTDMAPDNLSIMLNNYQYVFTHEPISNINKNVINIHGHLHNGSSAILQKLSLNHINVIGESHDFLPLNLNNLLKTDIDKNTYDKYIKNLKK